MRPRACVYYQCGAEPVLIARVLSGDGDELHETDNPLCAMHWHSVIGACLYELRNGGPVQRMHIVQAAREEAAGALIASPSAPSASATPLQPTGLS